MIGKIKTRLKAVFPQWFKNYYHYVVALTANLYYKNPSKKLIVIGVTGTDGKTTTVNIIAQILNLLGEKAGVVSTVSTKIGAREFDTGFHVTNPGSFELQKFISEMIKEKCKYAVIEVTSHGIDQWRIAGVDFEAAVLTNITSEHLDYHKTFENYRDTKAKLFKLAKKIVVLNKDDFSHDHFCTIVQTKCRLIAYSIKDKSADFFADEISINTKGLSFGLHCQRKSFDVSIPLYGNFNVSNTLAAVAVCTSLGIDLKKIIKTFPKLKSPKGRVQRIKNERGINVFIDYAHTPNSVEKILKTFRSQKDNGNLIALVSAEGERDPRKRQEIPKVAVKLADFVILNPIDPRSEDPKNILREMEKGATRAGATKVETKDYLSRSPDNGIKKYFVSFVDRSEAIDFAINKVAKKGDTVLILGKGHETGMDYGDHEEPWSDEDEVKKVLSKK